MLKKIRVALAAIFFVGITLLFLDITGVLHLYLGWMAKIQFLPAVLALNFAVVAVLALVTLLFGRVYCSVICPLGIMQDISSHLSGMRKGKKMRFRPKKENKWLRYGMLGVFIIALIAGIHALVALLAPYSTYGRIVQNLFQPLYILCNNLFASIAERAGSYAFYDKEVWIKSLPTFIIAGVMFLLIIFLSWKDGRTWCNSICPVGTTLGFLSRFAMFRPIIDTEKCKDCHACERKCKASCIDIESHKIDYSRCVDCFNCIDNCKFDALHYKYAWGKSSTKKDNESKPESRRAFIATTVAMTAGASLAKAQEKVDGGYAEIIDKKKPKRQTPIVPPGAKSLKNLSSHCTACQLCVAECPNDVLRPSTDLSRLMQPESSYERGYCRPECTRCSEVCPTGAILRLSAEDKSSTQIGHAVTIRENCIPVTDGVSCGNCARHCPVGAIIMVPLDPEDPDSLKIPSVNEERCIGCGACENLCPSRPYSAIYVEGHSVHRTV